MDWKNEAVIDTVVRMTEGGKSASQIGRHFGVTRNAVCGAIWRIRQSGRSIRMPELTYTANKPRTPPTKKPKTRALPMPNLPKTPRPSTLPTMKVVEVAAYQGLNPVVTLFVRHGQCRFPVTGRGAEAMLCGDGVVDGKVYCAAHCQVAYMPRSKRKHRRAA